MKRSAWLGKTAVVCGASQGFGLAVARQLCRERAARVIIVARDPTRLEAATVQLRSDSSSSETDIRWLAADLRSPEEARRLASELHGLGPCDLLVQAVGMSDRGALQNLEAERLRTLLDVNLLPSLHAIRHLPDAMARPATIVLIGSLACHFAPRYLGGYSIAKHALSALAQQSRLELADEQIHVMLASPGPIQRDDAGERYANSAGEGKLPASALRPGGGAKVRGLSPERLAADILQAAAQRRPLVLYPMKARWLLLLTALSPRLGDWLLRRNSS
jgi:uncharacterized protein